MNVHDALSQIADIRQQVARAQAFRGYRAATTAFTAVVAITTAAVQAVLLPEPHVTATVDSTAAEYTRYQSGPAGMFRIDQYLYLWFIAAMLSLAVVGAEMFLRVRRSDSDLQRDLTSAAIEQFVPSLVAGFLLTIVIVQFAFDSVWMLPGLWMILFAMGVFASRRVLPRFAVLVAGFYLMAGLGVISLQKQAGLHAWTMGLVFGVGQTAAAGMLWVTRNARQTSGIDD